MTADAHHHRTMRGIVLIMSALFMFSAMDTLAVNWKHMRRLSDASDQPGTH